MTHLPERNTYLGASDVAVALGFSPFKSPLDLWLEKTGRADRQESTLQMRFGTMAEQFVADEYQERTGRMVEVYKPELVLPDTPIKGHIDRLVIPEGSITATDPATGKIITDRFLECKTANPRALNFGEWGEEGTDHVPQSYLVQVLLYHALTGCEVADISALFGNQEIRIYTILRDTGLEADLIQAATDWWNNHVVKDVAPGPRSASEAKKLWPSHKTGKQVIVDVQVYKTFQALAAIKEKIKEAEEIKTALEKDIFLSLQDAEEAVFDGQTVATWKANKGSQVTDWQAIAKAMNPPAELVQAHTSNRPGARVLRVKKLEKELTE